MESVIGEGTTFRVILPVATRPLGDDKSPTVEVSSRGRVLVVDDEPAILSALRRILAKEHEVVALSDGREALKLLESGARFDVVFCDLMMPHLDGPDLYARVRAIDPAFADRFVFITGGATESRSQAFLAQVPNERVDKPFSVQNLRGIVRRFVEARAAAR